MALLTIEPRQDLFSIAGGSWDFYHPGVPDRNIFSFLNSDDFLRRTIPAVLATGGALEFEIVEPSHLDKLRRLADDGVFDIDTSRFWLDYCFGFGGMPATRPRLRLRHRGGPAHLSQGAMGSNRNRQDSNSP